MLWIIIICLVLAGLIAYGRHLAKLEEKEAIDNLRHTIEVNLSILTGELVRLTSKADQSTNCKDLEKVRTLLDSARTTAESARTRVTQLENRAALGKLLAEVFHAMNQTTDVFGLLNHYPND